MKPVSALVLAFLISCVFASCDSKETQGDPVTISKDVLLDKVKGGWAGQVIGCTYGGPTEFQWNGTMIGDHVPIPWDDTRMLWYYENSPGLYDDVYMDLTFVEVFEKYGIDAPDSLHALAFARAGYPLWHANQAARYNILNGIMPPESGFWKYNPHADDIDFQIEADFAGLMSPGMVNAASDVAWRLGHIMNYGDGVYGGVYVAAMYALAFVNNDMEFIVREALKTIPPQSEFYQCIQDVITSYEKDPDDWKSAWFDAQKKWTYDKGCPDGVFRPFNIDAKINAAYIVIGLLYGKGDYGATIDISTRCGYDSDCNPANAAGILGTMLGYSQIPDFWKQGLDKVEDLKMVHTDMSLNRVYEVGLGHALQMVERNGGSIDGDQVTLPSQVPNVMPLEIGFDGIYPKSRSRVGVSLVGSDNEHTLQIEGCGFVIGGRAVKEAQLPDSTLEVEVYIDGELFEVAKLPTLSLVRRHEVTWKYDLPEGAHAIRLVPRDLPDGYRVELGDCIVYTTQVPGKRTYY